MRIGNRKMMWLQNLANAGAETGTPIGPGGAGIHLPLLYVGRIIVLGFAIEILLSSIGL